MNVYVPENFYGKTGQDAYGPGDSQHSRRGKWIYLGNTANDIAFHLWDSFLYV